MADRRLRMLLLRMHVCVLLMRVLACVRECANCVRA
jgi:hypothetical protein